MKKIFKSLICVLILCTCFTTSASARRSSYLEKTIANGNCFGDLGIEPVIAILDCEGVIDIEHFITDDAEYYEVTRTDDGSVFFTFTKIDKDNDYIITFEKAGEVSASISEETIQRFLEDNIDNTDEYYEIAETIREICDDYDGVKLVLNPIKVIKVGVEGVGYFGFDYNESLITYEHTTSVVHPYAGWICLSAIEDPEFEDYKFVGWLINYSSSGDVYTTDRDYYLFFHGEEDIYVRAIFGNENEVSGGFITRNYNVLEPRILNANSDLFNIVPLDPEEIITIEHEHKPIWAVLDAYLIDEVHEEDEELFAKELGKGETISTYIILNFEKTFDFGTYNYVDELLEPVTIQMEIPEEIRGVPGREYNVYRRHADNTIDDYVVTKLDTEVNGIYLTFESDQFSLFAISYKDNRVPPVPNTSTR